MHHACAAGLTLHLDNLKIYNPTALAKGAEYSGNVLVAPTAAVGKGCLIGPDVSIGDGCVIGDGVRLSNCVVMRGVRIKDHCKVGVACRHGTPLVLLAAGTRAWVNLLPGVAADHHCAGYGYNCCAPLCPAVPSLCLQIDKSIIGWDSTVGAWCRLENHCVLGEDVQVKVSRPA